MSDPQTELPTAGVIKRLAAMVYDSLLIFGLLFTATIPTLFFQSDQALDKNNEQVVHELPTLVDGWPFQLYLLLVYISFFCWFWRKNGQTLGMQAWRLHVVDKQGQRISLKQCLQRIAGAFISAACLGAGYWWIWFDKDNLAWHDHWSQSRIVVRPKQK
ncbi:RDD family protein [Oceanicoccus sagamiensis]|uniref:RDD family protein n=1 Tax=Oceanicoccus sagamiensis TaxID=716816 RepID=A0A1X9NIR4_9GAMM|nr:RDD family protein [Oceanicoccus sagamiensis]ARN75379.1 RDD family protein [Oceanicoccus sagamiensis]